MIDHETMLPAVMNAGGAIQSISTKYLGPTNSRGGRIKATASGGQSLTIGYPHALNQEAAHSRAAMQLAAKLDWRDPWYVGGLDGDGYVFVQVSRFGR